MFSRIAPAASIAPVVFAFGSVHAQFSFEERLALDQPPSVIAHRSAILGKAPENTLAWIQNAIDLGVDVVHINPQRTADDEYVLMHDSSLNRTTDVESVFAEGPPDGPTRQQRGGRDFVGDYRLADIKRLRILNGYGVGEHPVPTLDEALDLAERGTLVLLGLKTYEIDSLAAGLEGRKTQSIMFFELYYSGTDQSKLSELSETTGIDASVTLFGSRDYVADLNDIYAQLGPKLKMVIVDSSHLTKDFVARMEELRLHLVISGWDGPEDYALVHEADPKP